MTVRELIENLSDLDPDMTVIIFTEDDAYSPSPDAEKSSRSIFYQDGFHRKEIPADKYYVVL